MDQTKIACSMPHCGVLGLPEAMWLPAWDALRRANGGKAVPVGDLAKFALCGKHGRLLREEKVSTFRFDHALTGAKKQEERRKAEDSERLAVRFYAQKFLPAGKTGKEQKREKPNGRSSAIRGTV